MAKHVSVCLKLHPLSLQDSVCTRIKQELHRKRKKEASDRETAAIERENKAKRREEKARVRERIAKEKLQKYKFALVVLWGFFAIFYVFSGRMGEFETKPLCLP